MFVTLKVLNEIKKLREKEENEAELRLRKALDNKGFRELYLKLKSLNFDIAKNEFLGKNVFQKNGHSASCVLVIGKSYRSIFSNRIRAMFSIPLSPGCMPIPSTLHTLRSPG